MRRINEIGDSVKSAQDLFEEYNQGYFDGALSGYRVIVCDVLNERGMWAGEHVRKERAIYIQSDLKGLVLDITLLHEVCHAASNDNHGPKWLKEMQRLVELGVEILEREIDLYRT